MGYTKGDVANIPGIVPMVNKKTMRANAMLLLTAVIWGGGFVAQRVAMQFMGPFTFNGFRFALGALTLLPVLAGRGGKSTPADATIKSTLLVGSIAGFFLFFGATFQQLGLVYTTAGKGGFVTGLYIIIVPLLGMIWGDQASFKTWLGAVLAVAGLYFLSVKEDFTLALGDAYVLAGAFFWAGHVQFIAHFTSRVGALRLSFVQALVTSVASFGVGILLEESTAGMVADAFLPIVYGGVVSIGIAYTLQIVAQQQARPTHAAIILSLESVFAVLWGWLLLGELLSGRGILGSALMLAGMILAQLPDSEEKEGGEVELHP